MKLSRGKQKGAVLIEFAIIAPLLLLILFGIIEFGLILYNQAVITNASREGARYGIVAAPARRTEEQIRGVVESYCNDRLVTFGTQTPLDVSAIPIDTTTFFGDDLEVRVSWNYTFLVLPNFTGTTFSNPLSLRARTVMKYE